MSPDKLRQLSRDVEQVETERAAELSPVERELDRSEGGGSAAHRNAV